MMSFSEQIKGMKLQDAAGEQDERLWMQVRAEFNLSPEWLHLGASQFLASHPRMVREALEHHRRLLDENPVMQVEANEDPAMDAVREAAMQYLGSREAREIALTDSTTMGLGLVYSGFPWQPGDEIVLSDHEHYSHREAARGVSTRHDIQVQTVKLYDGSAAQVRPDEMVERIMAAVNLRTRVIGATWVHSDTGLKFPVRLLADAIAEHNRNLAPHRRVKLIVDGVHGLGIEPDTLSDLGADFFVAGTHKWLYGPRGTGLVWASLDDWRDMRRVIPSFTEAMDAYSEDEPLPPMDGRQFTPGGFHSLEHRWATVQAFEFHRQLGRKRVAARIHALNRQCREALSNMPHVTLHTPREDALSSGITAFELHGIPSADAEERLREQKIIATVAPYPSAYLRLTPGIINTPQEVERALTAISQLS
ncbi:aminotransferase class V-fold PLP-dependent enzyme [Deinococcus oregonensis]|uniref:Aminotransferase class V-fold PLP-dependent enzyme n=1 Tax=Deinococcus oregonensis TaxID=1805970 RepID=A0ABV6AZ32_9DEIO